MLIYGSILIEVTLIPLDLRMVPMLLAMTPLPMPLITPPVTKMYFILNIICRVYQELQPRFLSDGVKENIGLGTNWSKDTKQDNQG